MSSCSCLCDYDGAFEVFYETKRKARKDHKCYECRQTIQKGDVYQWTKALLEGEWEVYRFCLPCWQIRVDYCYCAPFGELIEHIWELLDVNYITGEVD